jgi:hypothetical protein
VLKAHPHLHLEVTEMKKVSLARLGLVMVILTATLAGCANEATAPSGPIDQTALSPARVRIGEPTRSIAIGNPFPCNNPFSERFCPVALDQPTLATVNVTSLATLRVRCEARGGSGSKISVDGNNLPPRNGSFRARVRAAGGTVTSAARRAVGDEVEFDFDSDRGDIARGATRIPARFIVARSGPDVIGELLNAQGRVVARQGAECRLR